MPSVPPPPLDPVADVTEPSTTVRTASSGTWYDPDASSWEPQQPTLFEALRASPPRPAIAVGPGRAASARRPAAPLPARRP